MPVWKRLAAALVLVVLVAGACSNSGSDDDGATPEADTEEQADEPEANESDGDDPSEGDAEEATGDSSTCQGNDITFTGETTFGDPILDEKVIPLDIVTHSARVHYMENSSSPPQLTIMFATYDADHDVLHDFDGEPAEGDFVLEVMLTTENDADTFPLGTYDLDDRLLPLDEARDNPTINLAVSPTTKQQLRRHTTVELTFFDEERVCGRFVPGPNEDGEPFQAVEGTFATDVTVEDNVF